MDEFMGINLMHFATAFLFFISSGFIITASNERESDRRAIILYMIAFLLMYGAVSLI